MRWIIIILLVLLIGCVQEAHRQELIDEDNDIESTADNTSGIVIETSNTSMQINQTETVPEIVEPELNITVNATINETEIVNDSYGPETTIEYPQSDPKLVVEAYLQYITRGLDGDKSKFSDAYDLVSPHTKKNQDYAITLTRFTNEAGYTYDKYDHGGEVYEFEETKTFGNSYRVYYNSSEGDIFYNVELIEDNYWIASGSKLGSMFWRKK